MTARQACVHEKEVEGGVQRVCRTGVVEQRPAYWLLVAPPRLATVDTAAQLRLLPRACRRATSPRWRGAAGLRTRCRTCAWACAGCACSPHPRWSRSATSPAPFRVFPPFVKREAAQQKIKKKIK
jgi:hypothetical protein